MLSDIILDKIIDLLIEETKKELKAANNTFIFKRLERNLSIKAALAHSLRRNYDNHLSKIYFEYFA